MYARPRTIEEATLAMSANGALAIAGGTDVYPAHAGRAITRPLVDLSGVAALRGITEAAEGFRFGAATSWSMIARAELPPAFDGLKAAARAPGPPAARRIRAMVAITSPLPPTATMAIQSPGGEV